MTLTLAMGMAIGIVMGLTGAGGGILAVPALVFGMHLTMAEAAPVALVAVAIGSTIGAIEGLRRGLVRYRAALLMATCGVAAAPAGLAAADALPERALLVGFAIAMAIVAARMARESHADLPLEARSCQIDPRTGRFRWTPRAAATLGAIGTASGLLSGLLGVGGGFVIVPALRRFTDLAMQGVVATSLALVALVSTGAVAIALAHGRTVPLALALPFAAAVAGGVLAGRSMVRRLPPRAIQRVFAAATALVAIAMLVRAA